MFPFSFFPLLSIKLLTRLQSSNSTWTQVGKCFHLITFYFRFPNVSFSSYPSPMHLLNFTGCFDVRFNKIISLISLESLITCATVSCQLKGGSEIELS